ncbi:hypothetical protein FOL47_003465, partial [Perkinsus chesapeaki]
QLYDAGFVSPKMVAGATTQELQVILRRALPPQVPDVPQDALERLISDAAVTAKEQRKQKMREAREFQVTVSHRPIPEAPPPVVVVQPVANKENASAVQPQSPARPSRLSSASLFTPGRESTQVGFTPGTGYNDFTDPTDFLWASQRERTDSIIDVDPERLSAGLSRLGRRSLTLKDKIARLSAEALSSMPAAKRRRLTTESARTSGAAVTPDTSLLQEDVEPTERRRSSVANPRDLQQRRWMVGFLTDMPPIPYTSSSTFDLTDTIYPEATVFVCQLGVRDSITVMWVSNSTLTVEYALLDDNVDQLKLVLESCSQYTLVLTESAADFWRLLKQKVPELKCSACLRAVVVDLHLMAWLRNPDDSTGPSLEKYVKQLPTPHYTDPDLKKCLGIY